MKMSETSQPSSENDGKGNRQHGSRKRQVHNEVERRRKDKINGWISKIAELLPRKEDKQSKISTLEQTVDYIKLLVAERNKLLSENCSEVQAEEIRKLKKDLHVLSEQNTLYARLLEQSDMPNIPSVVLKKQCKYSNKFVRKNGVLTVKNSESDTRAYVDCAVQVGNSMCLNNIPDSVSVNSSTTLTCESPKVSKGKNNKSKSKTIVTTSKPVKIVPVSTINSGFNSSAVTNSLQSNNSMTTPLTTQTAQQLCKVSQENVFPVIDWNDSTRNSASAQAGGVTTVLSQFPVMSTTLGSSFSNVCNKNVPTIIIPTGGNILQSFAPEKLSNTISIICPSTLPILVPQQVLNVPSVARNVGLPPTIICPSLVENTGRQVEKTNLGSALLTLNPNPIVPISSSLSANARIVLPPQPTLLSNNSGNVNLTHNVISPLVTAVSPSEDLTVPLVQKLPISSTSKFVQDSTNASDNSCNTESSKAVSNEPKSVENALETSKNMPNVTSLPSNASVESKTSQISMDDVSKKKIKRDSRSLCTNVPPSLQVLSANKIIAIANQTQNSRNKTSNKKVTDKIICKPVTFSENKPNEPANSFCTPMDTSSEQQEHNKRNGFNRIKEAENLGSDITTPQSSPDLSLVKSNFSLTVLMGKCLADKNLPGNSKKSENDHFPHDHNIVSVSETTKASAKNVKDINNSLENVSFPNISQSEIVFSVAKESVFESSVQISSNTHSSETNSETKKLNDSKTSISDNHNYSNTEVLTNLPANARSPVVESNTHPSFNNTDGTNSVINTSSIADSNVLSEQNSEASTVSSKDNSVKSADVAQNNQTHAGACSDLTSSVNSLNENVPYSVNSSSVNHSLNSSSVNHSLLPSLFSNNQIVSLNSQVLVCHTGNENSSGVLLPQSLNISNETTNQNLNQCLLHYSQGDFQAFSVLSDSMATLSSINDSNKRSSEISLNFSENSGVNNPPNNVENHKIDNSTENDSTKEFLAAKRKSKPTYRESKLNLNDKNNPNSESSSSSTNSKIHLHTVDIINSFSKNDSPNCSKAEPGFSYASNTSDILARATETIFCNDILENSQASKRNECFSDDVSNLNETATASEKIVSNFKMQYNRVREDHSIPDASVEKNKKNISDNNILHPDISSSIQNAVKNSQELNSKQVKFCKVRKQKSNNDSEPPYKKLKETPVSDKIINTSAYEMSNQNEKANEKNISIIHSNLTFLEKQVSSSSQTSPPDDQSVADSVGNYNNQIHISENNCKTPSVDTIFSLTPMLGDILKDVSHNVNLDSRNTFATGHENQPAFSSEKNFISFNYQNSSHEDYLNLPRMSFPIIPEISATPVVHVTSVSFAHSVSLCSTQSDSQKVTETHSSAESQNKSNSKKKEILPIFHGNHNILNIDLASDSNITKQSDCAMKTNNSEPHFNSTPAKVTNSSAQFENQHSVHHIQSGGSVQSTNLVVSQPSNQYNSRENFISPICHSLSFYPTISSSSNAQNFPCTTTSLSHNNFSNNLPNIGKSSVSFGAAENMNNSFSSQIPLSKPDNLSHSLCSLLKENSSIVENRSGTSETASQSTPSSSNVTQSKYSALSLISDQTPYSESVTSTTCHSHFAQSSAVHTTSVSDGQYVSTVSSCSRNPKTSLSYSAESLLQTSCVNSEKNKNNKNGRFQLRTTDKKVDRSGISHMHSIHDTNVFMPVTSCDINIQNAPLVPLPPVTSFHNFSSSYSVCDSSPSTTIFNSVSRNQDIPLSLSSDNFLNHINLNVDSQMLNNRHDVSSAVPKPHSNVTLQFENSNSLYNNCNFLPHVKPALENSRSSETSQCFQASSYNNNYSQQSQKPNCCQFTHRAVPTNSDMSSDINLSVSGVVPAFHNEKNNFQPNRPGLQTSFSQNNSNFMGNFFYNAPANCHDANERNDINIKPSTIRSSQEMFVPEGVRQNIHDQNTNIIFNNRKSTPSNRTKSKKPKNISSNESVNVIPTCASNYNASQDNSCNKVNISYVPNDYFKSSSNPVLPAPGPIQCSQNKISETMPPAVIPANPSFNPVLHQQSDTFLNLNFQHANFTMSPLPRPPTQPLSCSCLTTPIISHTFSTSTPHPVPNFNLSNILPDMGCSSNQVSFSPPKFPMNHPLSSSSTQCQTSATITNSAHIVSHQSCAPSLYPPHPPMVRGTLNPILSHNSQSLIDSQVSLVASAGSVMSQNTTFTATQNPTFRNVIHPISFPRNDR